MIQPNHPSNQNGFTLVELSIVMVIVGLLIGGVLMGSNLLETARIASTVRLLSSYNAAVSTFKASYGALPGDIKDPARISDCTSTTCLMGGNGNGQIGSGFTGTGNYYSDEQTTFWMHLGAAGYVNGIDQNKTWTTNPLMGSFPTVPINGQLYLVNFNFAPSATYPDGFYGYYWCLWAISDSGVTGYSTPVNVIGKLDKKIDDGNPWRGKITQNNTCNTSIGATSYDSNNNTLCNAIIRAEF